MDGTTDHGAGRGAVRALRKRRNTPVQGNALVQGNAPVQGNALEQGSLLSRGAGARRTGFWPRPVSSVPRRASAAQWLAPC